MTEEYREELREQAEQGRRYRIAMEVWREFLDDRRETLVRELERRTFAEDELRCVQNELRVMDMFRRISATEIQRGEIAEEELRNGE